MGVCRFCGENAGFARKVHKACEEKNTAAEQAVRVKALEAAQGRADPVAIAPDLRAKAAEGYVRDEQLHQLLVAAWERAVESFLEDGLLSRDEENALGAYLAGFGLSQHDFRGGPWYLRVAAAGALRDLTEGKFPARLSVDGAISFNLQAKERLAWVFTGVVCYEERSRREYVGGHHGASVRVAKGLYYRVGAFRGSPVDTSFMHLVGSGMLGLTDKHLYFAAPGKAFRVPYKKVASFESHPDGMTVHRDGANSRPITFISGDGWSLYNLALNLSQLGA